MQSQSLNAFCAAGTAEAPKPKPAWSGWLAGNTDRPCRVVATGASSPSARRTSCSGGVARAPAGEDAGMLGIAQQFDGRRDLSCRLTRRRRRRNREFTGLVGQQEDVDRQLHEDRPGSPTSRSCRPRTASVRPGHDGDPERRLGQPAHEFVGVHLVQLIAVAGIAAWPARQHQHRHAIRNASPMPLAAWVSPRPEPPSTHRWNRRAGRLHRP